MGEIAGETIGDAAWAELNNGLPIAKNGVVRTVQQRSHGQGAGQSRRTGNRQLDFECDQHGLVSALRSGTEMPGAAGC